MCPIRFERALRVLCVAAVLSPAAATGQVLTSLEFNFSNPGARSMGFGGAFVALADDATAAFANPAGLVQLTLPEVSAEVRSRSCTTLYTRGGRAAGEPTGFGMDTVAGPLTGESTADTTGLSFLSFVYPKKRWSLALYQHQLLDFEASQEIQGIFVPENLAPVDVADPVFAETKRGPIEVGSFDFEVVTRGLAVALQATERLSLGLGLTYFDPTIVFHGREYLPDDGTMESFFAEASLLPERLVETRRAERTEEDWGLTAGFLWKLSQRWKLGGVYRKGPDLEIDARAEAGPVHPDLPPGSVERFTVSRWSFPDVYGLGVAYRSENDRWTASFEWDRVEYSDLVESDDPRISDPGDVVDDADELHLGLEYVFVRSTPALAARVGLWHDPDHRKRDESDDLFGRAELRPGEDELHVTAGFGAAFRAFQIDLGIDLSERNDTASVSAIYSF